jgi:circadian clock protein KaiC
MEENSHSRHVRSWMEHAAKEVPSSALLVLFEEAWRALWRRSESAVGEVALESISQLIRANAVERYPFLSPLILKGPEVSYKALLGSLEELDKAELQAGLCIMLVEFLSVIGDLTDQILTPGLYEVLSRIEPGSVSGRQSRSATAQQEAKEAITMTAKSHPNGRHAPDKELISTGIRNLDEMLTGGLISGSSIALAGPPGSGKTILAQQIAFQNATDKNPVVYFSTLSEPGTKTLFYLNKFSFFEPKKLDKSIHFVDLGVLVRAEGLKQTLALIMDRVRTLKPAIVIIDSFKVFEDMAASPEDLRKFSYELVVNLMTRKCTSLFLGEYAPSDFERNPLFSIIDGIVSMTQRENSGEQQRFIQVNKMRGLAHSRDEYTFKITPEGIEIFAPRLTIKRTAPKYAAKGEPDRCKIGIGNLDALLDGGIPRGSSLLIAGVAGTGKTVLGLEFIYRGALAGEKGVLFSFEETEARLLAAARGLGWDFDDQVKKGMIEIVFIPQPEIMVEHHLLMMQEKIARMGAKRVTVDSLSVFLHKTTDPQIAREKVFQISTIVQNAGAVGFFATDIPYGSDTISRFGVEETVIDGVIILTSTSEDLERQRYLEVYKLRNTVHLKGRHAMTIEAGGMRIFPRYSVQEIALGMQPPPPKVAHRLTSGVEGLDTLLGSGLLARSITLVSGSSGIGKSLLALQFLLEGAGKREHGLFVTLEEGPEELLANAKALGLPLQKAVDDGLIEIVYLPPTHIRSTQLLALVTGRIAKQRTKRLVLDSTTHIVSSGLSRDGIREMLFDLVFRLKELGVTSLFTLESDLMYSTDSSTDTYRGFAPLSDNVVVLRYAPSMNKVISTLMVVKTRGSAHDKGLYAFSVGKGGIKIGPSLDVRGPTKDVSGPTGDQQAQAAEMGRKH